MPPRKILKICPPEPVDLIWKDFDGNCEAVNVVLATCTITKNATLHGKWPFMVGGYALTLISLYSVMLKPRIPAIFYLCKEYYNYYSVFKRMGRLKCNSFAK